MKVGRFQFNSVVAPSIDDYRVLLCLLQNREGPRVYLPSAFKEGCRAAAITHSLSVYYHATLQLGESDQKLLHYQVVGDTVFIFLGTWAEEIFKAESLSFRKGKHVGAP